MEGKILFAIFQGGGTDVSKNIDLIEENTSKAKCDLILFPELYLTGYSIGSKFEDCEFDLGFLKLIE
jgi:predicted amidohydrolase